MSKKFDSLNETFNVQADIISTKDEMKSIEKKIEIINESGSDDLKKDYEYSRGNLYSIIEKGQEALNGILEIGRAHV